MSIPIIEVQGLSKVFRQNKKRPGIRGALRDLFHRDWENITAVKELSFSIQTGELVGFLGPNGAGKTTTLKMLAGLLYPTGGAARVLGFVPWERKNAYRRQFALLLGQKNQLWWDLPARESLELNARIYGISRSAFLQTLREMTELLDVDGKLDVMVRELSLGERMKFELIAALLHQPKVLFLDEPTIGLDVVSQKVIREFIREHNTRHQTTIILTSHYMADIAALCPRVIIIDHGALFFDGKLKDIVDRFADYKLITLQYPPESTPARTALEPFGEVVMTEPGQARLKVKRDRVIAVCKAILDQLPVSDLDIQDVPIEEVIRRIFGG